MVLRRKLYPPTTTTTTNKPKQGLCCPRNQRNTPSPFAPPPPSITPEQIQKTQPHQQHFANFAASSQQLRVTTRTPTATLPPCIPTHVSSPPPTNKSMSPSTPTVTQQVLSRGWGGSTSFSPQCPHWGAWSPPKPFCRAKGHLACHLPAWHSRRGRAVTPWWQRSREEARLHAHKSGAAGESRARGRGSGG